MTTRDTPPQISDATEDYLKAVLELTEDGVPAATGDIARLLGITAQSVTGMLAKMRDGGLVHYEPYRGATLTQKGNLHALRLVRRHRLLETFMIEKLGYTWDEVHVEAERIEHALSDVFTDRLAAFLGHPSRDPHGDPIPGPDGSMPKDEDVPLTSAEVGDTFIVRRVGSRDTEVLQYLQKRGIVPGIALVVEEGEPGGAVMHVREGRTPIAVSADLASEVFGALHDRSGNSHEYG